MELTLIGKLWMCFGNSIILLQYWIQWYSGIWSIVLIVIGVWINSKHLELNHLWNLLPSNLLDAPQYWIRWWYNWIDIHDTSPFYSKLYIPSTLNIDLVLWHTQLIVCAENVDHGLKHGVFLSLFKLISFPIHWIVFEF